MNRHNTNSTKKILVTGAAGFVGANLVYELQRRDEVEIIAVVRSDKNAWRLNNLSSNVVLEQCDLSNYEQVVSLIETHQPNIVIHLATNGVHPSEWADPAKILTNNFSMSANLLEALKNSHDNLSGLVMIGTIYEYGNKPGLLKEDQAPCTKLGSLYATSKRISAILTEAYMDILPITTLRFSTIYGPYNDQEKFIEGSILKYLRGDIINVAEGVAKDFVYIDDAISAIISTLEKMDNLKGEIINIGGGKGYVLEDIVDKIKNHMKIDSQHATVQVNKKFRRKNEVNNWVDTQKAKKLLNWIPKYSIDKGISMTVDWCKKNPNVLPKTAR